MYLAVAMNIADQSHADNVVFQTVSNMMNKLSGQPGSYDKKLVINGLPILIIHSWRL